MVTYGFFNSVYGDRKYDADQMSDFYTGIVTQGVFQHVDNGLEVTAGTGLTVSVNTGRAIIQNKWVKNDTPLVLELAPAPTTYDRFDIVVLKYDSNSRNVQIIVKTGTPVGTPVVPELVREGGIYEMCLAVIDVEAGATSVTVTDTRSDSSVCGWAAVAQATSGEVDQMLTDLKTGFDGSVYSTPAAEVQGSDQKLQDQITNGLVGVSITRTGSSGNRQFGIKIPKGSKWSYINNSASSQTLVAYYDDSTSATLSGNLNSGATYNGIAEKNIVIIGGWYNAAANFTVHIYGTNERINTLDSAVAAINSQISSIDSSIDTLGDNIDVLEGYYEHFPENRNLLDPSMVQSGKSLSATGAVTSGADYVSDFIKVKAGSTYYMSKNAAAFMWVRVCVYDSSKTFLSKSDYANHLTIPSDGAYIRIDSNADISVESDKYQFEENGVTAYIAFQSSTVMSPLIDGFVEPEMFGAIGDGDYDDSTAITNCFNYAVSNGLPVRFRRKTYRILSSINLPSNLYVDGNGATIKDTGFFTAFYGADCTVTIKNLKFTGMGNATATDNKAIRGAFFYSTFENIWIEGFYRGIDLTGVNVSHSLVENKFTNIVVYDCYQGIKLGDNDGNARGTDGILENVFCRCNSSEYAIQLNTGSGWNLSNIHVYGEVTTAIFIVNAYACDISNVYIEYFAVNGIFINNQGNVNVNNVSMFIDEKDSACIYVEKSGWTTTSSVYVNITNVDVWVKSTEPCAFLDGTNCYVNISNYSKRGNVSNITDNSMNVADYAKLATYATL